MKLKPMAAAAALLCGANAFAGINTMDNDAELFFVVWDEAKATYVQDTGLTLGTVLDQATAKKWTFDVGASYAAYVAADGNLNDFSQFEGTRYGLFAVDNNNNFNFDGKDLNYLTTTTGGAKPTQNNEQLAQVTNGMADVFIFNQNQAGPLPIVLADNNNLTVLKGSPAHFLELTDYGGAQGLLAGNAIGSAPTAVFACSVDPFGLFDPVCSSKNHNGLDITTSFDGATFTVAVPEPGTYALLLAGLLTVGYVASRRRG